MDWVIIDSFYMLLTMIWMSTGTSLPCRIPGELGDPGYFGNPGVSGNFISKSILKLIIVVI